MLNVEFFILICELGYVFESLQYLTSHGHLGLKGNKVHMRIVHTIRNPHKYASECSLSEQSPKMSYYR